MELGSLDTAVLISIAILTVFSYFKASYGRKFPPGPPAWPVIGHLHLLGSPAHRSLHKLSQKFGHIYLIRLGSMRTVVISSAEMAKEFLHTHDQDFLDRPPTEATVRLFYNKSMIFMKYGPQWRELRKMYALQILTVKRIDMSKHIRIEEVSFALQKIEQQFQEGGSVVEMMKLAFNTNGNILSRMLLSKRFFGSQAEGSKFQDMVLEITVLFGATPIGDVIPYLRWLDFSGYKKRMDSLAKRLDGFLEDIISDRKAMKRDSKEAAASDPNDFLDLLLDIYKGNEGSDADWIKAILLEVLSSGIDTSSTAIEWAMAELLRNPSAMNKLQQELDAVVGLESGLVEESDLPKVEYLWAVMKETFRLHPPFPLVLRQMSRPASEVNEVGGYRLPENARLLVNLWAMGRDATVWERPEEFKPERFVGSSIDVRGQHFELIPFGSGRRGCPGMNLALTSMAFLLANLVHRFEWGLPHGESPETLDMSEGAALMAPKAKPLMALAKARNSRRPTK